MKTDAILVKQAQGGDAAAYAELLSRHYDLMFRVAFQLLGTKGEAEDLTQDLCLTLATKINGFRGDSQFSTWLFRVVTNAAKDTLRKRKSLTQAKQGWGDTEILRRAEADIQKAELAWLHQAMRSLPDDLRETVVLVLGQELTHAAAGAVLDVSEGTISWRMSEVKKHLAALAQAEERYP